MKNTGPPPFGYTRRGGCLVTVKYEAAIRKRVFVLFAEHPRQTVIAEMLNAEGHRTRSGTIFSAQTIGRILADPIVLGVPGEIEQIVELELFECCQDILAEQKAVGGAKRSPRHLFAGLLYCSCGQKMYVPSSSKKYVCSDCRAKVDSSDLESVYVKQALNTELSSLITPLLQTWDAQDFSTKREVIEAICERIVVNDKCITIHFADL